jgi:hypothetical protein
MVHRTPYTSLGKKADAFRSRIDDSAWSSDGYYWPTALRRPGRTFLDNPIETTPEEIRINERLMTY